MRYHFPRAAYESAVRSAYGRLCLIYEPRRGGNDVASRTGGRMAFVGWAVLGSVQPDPASEANAYVNFTASGELPRIVPLNETHLKGKQFQTAVLLVEDKVIERVLELAMAPLLTATSGLPGLTDLSLPPDWSARPLREVITWESVRDSSFRFHVVDETYRGRCALSGLRLTNGLGRAEVDAAHIRPVASGGPDLVSNGLALTKTLHWAFDRGLVTVLPSFEIKTVERGLGDDARLILRSAGSALVPEQEELRPHPHFLSWHNKNVFKGIP